MFNKKIKILTCYHKPAELIKSDIITPIHGGRSLMKKNGMPLDDQKWMLENMAGDDTGDNISLDNPFYSELSVLYWMWKNPDKLDNPDYFGLMHYRRWFIFDNERDIQKQKKIMNGQGWSPGCVSCFNGQDANYFLGSDETIQKFIEEYDVTVPYYIDVRAIGASRVRDIHNFLGFKKRDSELLYKTIEKFCASHPNWNKALKFLNGHQCSLANMFVMKKELFHEYCDFLFPIISDLKEGFDYSYRSINGNRFLGYCSEILLGLFLAMKESVKVGFKQVSFLLDTELHKDITPLHENSVVIGVASDKKYAPYLAVYLQSIIETSHKKNNYEIFVLEQDIGADQKTSMHAMLRDYPNITIRFINPEYILSAYHFNYTEGTYSRAGYYRLALPLVLKNFNKVLYTDIDMIFKEDPAHLFSMDLKNAPLAACQDFIYGANLNHNPTYMAYAVNVLKLKNPYHYRQAGVLLINIPEWLKDGQCIELIKDTSANNYMIDDQDAVNKFFNDRIISLEPKWNAHVIAPHLKHLMDFMPAEFVPQHREALKNPGMLHWAAYEKPWNSPDMDKAADWWALAKKTPFYEQIIYKNTNIIKKRRLNLKKIIGQFIKNRRLKTLLTNIYYSIKTHLIRLRKKI